jgi:hypothetical protein
VIEKFQLGPGEAHLRVSFPSGKIAPPPPQNWGLDFFGADCLGSDHCCLDRHHGMDRCPVKQAPVCKNGGAGEAIARMVRG